MIVRALRCPSISDFGRCGLQPQRNPGDAPKGNYRKSRVEDGCPSGTLVRLPNFPREYLREQMPIAILLILIAMAHQRDVAATSQLLEQSQGELLAVILDPLVGSIETNAAVKELTPILAPQNLPIALDRYCKRSVSLGPRFAIHS
jgi:hypothetical protein